MPRRAISWRSTTTRCIRSRRSSSTAGESVRQRQRPRLRLQPHQRHRPRASRRRSTAAHPHPVRRRQLRRRLSVHLGKSLRIRQSRPGSEHPRSERPPGGDDRRRRDAQGASGAGTPARARPFCLRTTPTSRDFCSISQFEGFLPERVRPAPLRRGHLGRHRDRRGRRRAAEAGAARPHPGRVQASC